MFACTSLERSGCTLVFCSQPSSLVCATPLHFRRVGYTSYLLAVPADEPVRHREGHRGGPRRCKRTFDPQIRAEMFVRRSARARRGAVTARLLSAASAGLPACLPALLCQPVGVCRAAACYLSCCCMLTAWLLHANCLAAAC